MKGKEMVLRPDGVYYHDLDLKTNLWCVFNTETIKAYASFANEGEAKEEADKRNADRNFLIRF